jgi:hypothetical protein
MLPACLSCLFVSLLVLLGVRIVSPLADLVMMWRAPWEARSMGNTCFMLCLLCLLCLCSCVQCCVCCVFRRHPVSSCVVWTQLDRFALFSKGTCCHSPNKFPSSYSFAEDTYRFADYICSHLLLLRELKVWLETDYQPVTLAHLEGAIRGMLRIRLSCNEWW